MVLDKKPLDPKAVDDGSTVLLEFNVGGPQLFQARLTEHQCQRLKVMFPDGLTRHGVAYCFDMSRDERGLEAFFEFVRRERYPSRPSRFSSFFACPSITEAKEFRSSMRNPGDAIFEVEGSSTFRADMNAFHKIEGEIPHSLHQMMNSHLPICRDANHAVSLAPDWFLERAEGYWKGIPVNANPNWEVLLEPPVEILKRVD